VTREPFRNQGRLPDLIANGKLCSDIGFPQIDPKTDRAMICGGPAMLKDMRAVLDDAGFTISTGIGQAGDYVIERAFVEK
jgi:ferredoxin--NADP+ reductase